MTLETKRTGLDLKEKKRGDQDAGFVEKHNTKMKLLFITETRFFLSAKNA